MPAVEYRDRSIGRQSPRTQLVVGASVFARGRRPPDGQTINNSNWQGEGRDVASVTGHENKRRPGEAVRRLVPEHGNKRHPDVFVLERSPNAGN